MAVFHRAFFLAVGIAITLYFAASPRGQAASPHPHDDFASAAELSGTFVSWTNNTVGATAEAGEEILDPFISQKSVWARWTAPIDGDFRVVISPSHGMRVFRSAQDFESLATNRLSSIFQATVGTIYIIRITSDSTEPFQLRLGPLTPNVRITNALEVVGTNALITGQNWAAASADDSAYSFNWYRWVAPANGTVTYAAATNLSSPRFSVFHVRSSTVFSNVLAISSTNLLSADARSSSNSFVTTAGTTYLFGVSAAPTTNLGWNFQFERADVPVPFNAFVGGKAFWFSTNFSSSITNVLQAGLLSSNQFAWIEFTFPESGYLYFSSKLQGGSLAVHTKGDISTRGFSPHDWTRQVTHVGARYATNVTIRFVLRPQTFYPATVWISDFEYVPDTPARPQVLITMSITNTLILSFPIERNRGVWLQDSTNLLNWYANYGRKFSPIATNYSIPIPISKDEPFRFFRVHVIGGTNPT